MGNVVVFKSWVDERLKWHPRDYHGIDHTFTPADTIWVPEIELVNQDEMMNNGIEYPYHPSVSYNGQIEWQRQFRSRTSCSTSVANYPFDDHACDIIFAAKECSTDYLGLTVRRWNQQNRLPLNVTETKYSDTQLDVFKHLYWESNTEWTLSEYKYIVSDIATPKGEEFSTVAVNMLLTRSHSYYEITLFCPVILLAILSTVGIILPSKYFNNLIFFFAL